MRRQGGHYGGDSGGGGDYAYGGAGAQMHQQHQNSKSGYYQGRHQEPQLLGEKERGRDENEWRWERDDAQAKLPETPMSPTAPFAGGREAPGSYYQGQRLDPRMSMERQSHGDPRSQPHEEDMDIGYEDNHVLRTFEGLEQRFLDDVMKLSKEQIDAEDAENARHRERIDAINAKYQEQLVALRARHSSRREEFLRRESHARQQQYRQIVMDQYPPSGITPSDPRGFNAEAASAQEPNRTYNSDSYDSYRERGRFPGNARDHGHEPKVPYPRGRAYDTTGSRYY